MSSRNVIARRWAMPARNSRTTAAAPAMPDDAGIVGRTAVAAAPRLTVATGSPVSNKLQRKASVLSDVGSARFSSVVASKKSISGMHSHAAGCGFCTFR
ncbi:hypothetical protein [Sinomonas terrae]|uniref:Uncharacterized protein n=1 Tax=Sinomonas terrae TaxID=2908838 RepID=A0ABS9U424_9MICC|nr:hypothetical protein [Sinomonas terrae]MCH6471439.1 hypothetical protein [Sinomonas terrae]